IMVDTPPRTSLFLAQKQERNRFILQLRFDNFKPFIPPAISPGQTLTTILTDLTMMANYSSSSDFDKLRIPFRAVTTDLVSGQKVLLSQGDLAEAMRASIAIPLLFTPVEWGEMLLVDGGLINNIPVDETRQGGVDLVIAVDTTSKLRPRNLINAPWEVADQVTSIMQREKNQSQRTQADVLIKIELEDHLATDFTNLEELYLAGKQQTLVNIPEIKHLMQQQELKDLTDDAQTFGVTAQEIKGNLYLPQEMFNLGICPEFRSYRDVIQTMKDLYHSGYFSDIKAYLQKEPAWVKLTYQVQENPRLKKIRLEGNTVYPDSVILSQISTRPGQIINHHQSKKDLQAIIELYRKDGYSLASIKKIEFDPETGLLTIFIDEGKIADIRIEGNNRTRNFVVLREFPLKKGDIFNIKTANQGIKNIHSTDLFNTVRLRVIQKNSHPIVVIKLEEKKFDLIRLGSNYDRERKIRGFLELVDENLFGMGLTGSLHAQYGSRDQFFKTQLRTDRIFKTFLTFNLNLFHRKGKHYAYSLGEGLGQYLESNTGVTFSLGQQMKRLGTLSLEGRIEQTYLRTIFGSGFPPGRLDLKTLGLRSIVDTQNRFPFPTRGKYHHFYYEISSGKFLNSQVSYFKIFSSLESYTTYFKYHTFHPKFVWGTCDLTTPFPEQFQVGGETSFYGLRERELVGRYLVLASLEYRFRLPWKLGFDTYVHLRGDVAGVWAKQEDIKWKDFISGLGGGISWDTFLGPFTLAYGQASDGRTQFYFSAGYRF
ncbi:MAG: BamA/TamA family outer membrane protein, partial [candidate division KSB1 bacterium]|nr:BamA/TamA family outer membrane protein [candidate division KSB1 bacterium]